MLADCRLQRADYQLLISAFSILRIILISDMAVPSRAWLSLYSLAKAIPLLLIPHTSLVEATLSYGKHSFDSMPAHFGMAWTPPERTYQAHLQFLPDSPRLCHNGLDGLVLPNDTLPISLIVERGDCSFELKASIAMEKYPAISFMIVYDDEPRSKMVSMSETNPDHGITLGMAFVSHHSGMGKLILCLRFRGILKFRKSHNTHLPYSYSALRAILKNQTQAVIDSGGPIVQLDGLDPLLNEPSLTDLHTWILIAITGVMIFIISFFCLIVGVQLGIIPMNQAGNIIFSQDAIRHVRRLLTEDEVARLQPGGDLYGRLAFPEKEQEGTQQSPLAADNDGSLVDQTSDSPNNTEANSGEANGGDTSVVIDLNTPPEMHANGEEQSCAVCLDEFSHANNDGEEGNEKMRLPCSHQFHKHCIVPWLVERSATCPLCKFSVLDYITAIDAKSKDKPPSAFARCKQRARRLLRLGWSPIESNDTSSDSPRSEGDDTSADQNQQDSNQNTASATTSNNESTI